MQRIIFSIINIASVVALALLIFHASGTIYGIENKEHDMNKFESHYLMVFQKSVSNVPVQSLIEVQVDIQSKEFSPPNEIDGPIVIEEFLSSLGNLKKALIDACRNIGEIISLLDVSPDRRWVAVLCKTQFTQRSDGEAIYANIGYIININDVMAIKLPTIDPCYFSIDSKNCFFKEGWEIKQMNLFSGKISKIADATSFFLLPDRDRLMIFNNGEIWFSNIDGRKITTVGEYNHLVYTAGVINSEWGYFLTSRSSKGGKKELFFINLKSKEIIRYPHKIPEARLLRIISCAGNSLKE